MKAKLERVEIEAARPGDDDLAVDDASGRELFEEYCVKIGEVPIERAEVAALNIDVVVPAKHDRAETVPFRFEEKPAAGRKRLGQLGQHRLDRRR
jgi:hypothetical protein